MQPLAHPLNSMDKFLPISRSIQWPMRSTCIHRLTRVQYTDLTLSVFMPSQVHRMGAAMEWPWRTRCWPPGICGMMHNICTNPWYNYKSFSYFGYNLVMTNVTPRDWDLRDCSTRSCISSLILMRSNSSRFPTYTVVAPASNNIVSIHLWHIETGTKHWLNMAMLISNVDTFSGAAICGRQGSKSLLISRVREPEFTKPVPRVNLGSKPRCFNDNISCSRVSWSPSGHADRLSDGSFR